MPMKNFTKTLTKTLVCSSIIFAAATIADENKARVIHINSGSVVKTFSTDGENAPKIIALEKGTLSDVATLEEKLTDVDPEIRDKIMSLLQDIDLSDHTAEDDTIISKGVVKILKKDDTTGEIVDISAGVDGFHLSSLNLDDYLGSDVKLKTSIIQVLGNSTDAAIELLNKGEFSQHDLDRIQVALDEKR